MDLVRVINKHGEQESIPRKSYLMAIKSQPDIYKLVDTDEPELIQAPSQEKKKEGPVGGANPGDPSINYRQLSNEQLIEMIKSSDVDPDLTQPVNAQLIKVIKSMSGMTDDEFKTITARKDSYIAFIMNNTNRL